MNKNLCLSGKSTSAVTWFVHVPYLYLNGKKSLRKIRSPCCELHTLDYSNNNKSARLFCCFATFHLSYCFAIVIVAPRIGRERRVRRWKSMSFIVLQMSQKQHPAILQVLNIIHSHTHMQKARNNALEYVFVEIFYSKVLYEWRNDCCQQRNYVEFNGT